MYRVIDLHCDTIPNMYSDFREGKEASLLSNSGRIDLNRMREGGYILPVLFPFYPSGSIEEKRRVTIYTCIGACRFLENTDSGISGYHRTGDNSREYGRERQDGKAISYDDSGRGRSV